MSVETELGAFLKARRALVRPEDVGMQSFGLRRVSGLRREEVAVLADVSVDYYTRLERGRETGPSPRVLDAIARALRLDEDARTHLYRLAGQSISPFTLSTRGRVSPQLRLLMDGWPDNPAIVINRTVDVLARNQLADMLFSGFSFSENMVLKVFLDPAARTFYPEWEAVARSSLANLRLAQGYNPRDARLNEIITQLQSNSAEFRKLWGRHDARGKSIEIKRFVHPDVGDLSLTYHAFDVRGAEGQQLLVYHAEPGSPSAEALRLLGTLSATSRSFSDELQQAPAGQNSSNERL